MSEDAIAAVPVWVVVVTRARNTRAVGGLYGVFAIFLQQIVWNLFLGGAPVSP